MEISVTGRKMPVTDALKSYAEEKIGNSMKVMDIDPLIAEVILHVEQNRAIARPAICEVTMTAKGHIIRKSAKLDLDALMEELSDDEVVREKSIDLQPLTEEEALVEIDLLGHDFFAYTDRDTNEFRILYRRRNGGYGLLKAGE